MCDGSEVPGGDGVHGSEGGDRRDGENAAFEAIRSDGILRVRRPGTETEWLSTGWNGGRSRASAAYNVSVPTGWHCEDLSSYVAARLESAGFDRDGEDADDRGPVLLTGVDLEHARGATYGPVTVYATAGLSNPAALPMDPPGGELPEGRLEGPQDGGDREAGTVNLLVGTTRALESGALANLLAIAAEAKAATLLAETGFPGTTTDAVVAGHDPAGPPRAFSGSATAVGAATRACVREAVRASIRSRYDGAAESDTALPAAVDDAKYGVSTDVRATVFRPPLGARDHHHERSA